MSDRKLLDVRDLVVGYNGRAAVRGVSLSVRPGEVIGLLGHSGCGKSTLAYAMMGLTRGSGTISAGSVMYDGVDLMKLDAHQQRQIRGRDIGLIVQNPRLALTPVLPVGQQIEAAFLAHATTDRDKARQRALEVLRFVGINDPERRLAAYPHELSGGMAQRVLIAMALVSNPKLIIADEPTSGLDVTIQAQILDQLWQATRHTGSAIVLVTQEPGIVANYCDRVVVMSDGVIVEDVATAKFFQAPTSRYGREINSLTRRATSAAQLVRSDKSVERSVNPLMQTFGLSRTFEVRGSVKRIQAVQDVTFNLMPGETLGLVGESGSGKTTVGRCLLRLTEPENGKVTYRHTDLTELNPAKLRQFRSKLQIVLQDPYDSLNPRWTIARSLREPLDMHTTLRSREKQQRTGELLAMVGLEESVASKLPKELGGGDLQKICIARTLACDPDFIVLDEPTSVLDPKARVELVELLLRLQKERGIAYLLISHDLATVRALSHRVAVMYLSQIVEMNDTDRVFDAPQHPYTKALVSAYLQPGPEQRRQDRTDIVTLEGEIPSPIDLPSGCYLAARCPHALEQCRHQPQVLTRTGSDGQVRCWRSMDINTRSFPSNQALHQIN